MSVAAAIRPCAQCGNAFKAARRDSLYCSAPCKQAAYRKRQAPKPDLPPEAEAILVANDLIRGDLETKAERVAACVELVTTITAIGLVPALANAVRETIES